MSDEAEQSSGVIATINLVFRALRIILVILNVIVILFALFFMFTGRNLGWSELQMSGWARIILSLIAICIASYGIVVALWNGKKTKLHLKLILVHLISVAAFGFLGIILASVYVKKVKRPDIAFIVLSVVGSVFIALSSLGFGYALKKTKLLRRLNVLSSG